MQGRVVVWGAGSIGRRHAEVLRDRLHISPIVVPIRSERVRELKAEGFEACDDLERAVRGTQGWVIVCTETARHPRDTMAALALDCNVLCEKPLAATGSDIQSIAPGLAATGRRVFVACDLRFDRSLRAFCERLPEVGRVHSVRIECQSYLPDWHPGRDHRFSYSARANEGGVLRDLIHEVDYATWIFGRPDNVMARMGNTGRLEIESEEWAELGWATPAGTNLSIYLDYLSRSRRRCMRAYGERGEIEWDGIAQRVTIRPAGGPPQETELAQDRDERLAVQMEAFLSNRGNDPGGLATFEEGAFAVALCDAARQAAETGRQQRIAAWRTA